MIEFTEKDEIEAAFEFYRENGFPYPIFTKYEIIHIFCKLQKTKARINKSRPTLFVAKQKRIEVQSVGDVQLANFFHPHIWESHAMNMRSPMQSFYIDKSFRKVFRMCLKYYGNISKKHVNIFLRTVNGTQMCSNFRPTAAKAIYDYLKGDTVLDMSTGYGGRLLGFLASKCKGNYIGIDPSKKTCQGNRKISVEFNAKNRIRLKCCAFEDVVNLPKVDIAFTSTPYFTKEVYEEESTTQSRERYPEYKAWLNGFLLPMICKTREALKKNGLMAININDVKIKNVVYPLKKDTLQIAQKNGFILKETLQMVFPQFGKGLGKRKTEPIFIFKKD